MASTYLSRTSSVDSTSETKATLSVWIKKSSTSPDVSAPQRLFGNTKTDNTDIRTVIFFDNHKFRIYNDGATRLLSTAQYRDFSAWYHIVIEWDLTQATASDRIKLYINGERITAFDTADYPAQNATNYIPNFGYIAVGANLYSGSPENYFDGYMSHFHFCDGYAYDASTFGETDATTGIWKPKTAPSVTYGTNGFFLKFENSGSMGTDSSGNANNFTVNGNLTQTVDTPSNVFATFNALSKNDAGTVTFSNGNLTTAHTGTDSRYTSYSTLAPSQGKWYAEFKYASTSGGSDMMVGIGDLPEMENINRQGDRFGLSGNTVGYYSSDGNKYVGPSNTISAYGNSYAVGDIIGVAMDLDNGYVYFSKNGTWQNSGDPESGASGTGGISFTTGNPFIIGSSHITTTSRETSYNGNYGNGYFGTTAVSSATSDESGLGIFEYTVPSGYYALCTKNINTQEYA